MSAYLGNNVHGEEVYGTAEGGRVVMKDGVKLGELLSPSGFTPASSVSHRYKTVREVIEGVCAQYSSGGLAAIGAVAAIRAVIPYWESHFAERHGFEVRHLTPAPAFSLPP